MGRGRRRVPKEPPLNEYERKREGKIAENNRRLKGLGLPALASEVKTFSRINASTKKKDKRSGRRGGVFEGSDESSDYLPEPEDSIQGDGDTDLDVDDPVPLAIEPPARTRHKTCARRRKGGTNMVGPGSRNSKRVRLPAHSIQGVATRSSKRQCAMEQTHDEVEDDLPPVIENDGVGEQELPTGNTSRPPSPVMDWSYQAGVSRASQEGLNQSEQNSNEENEGTTNKAQRRPRPATRGVLLDNMTRAMGRRLPISVAEGKARPHDPVQAAKLASEAGVIVRSHVPIFTHWKDYKKDENHELFEEFKGRLAGRLAIDTKDNPTIETCKSVFKSSIRQMRYKLKKLYFNGIPADQIRITSPVSCMTDDEWCKLVEKWSSAKNKAISDLNKQNRGKVKYPQTTGSRCYVAQLHVHFQSIQKNAEGEEESGEESEEEINAIEAFKVLHTSRKKGISDAARDAVATMETLQNESVTAGQQPIPSAEVVAKVLVESQTSSKKNISFLKNAGIPVQSSKDQETATERALRQQLDAEKQGSAMLRQEVDDLKKRAEVAEEESARNRQQFEEFKKKQEENTLLLQQILRINGVGNFSQP